MHVIFSASTTGTAGQFRPYRITATNSSLSAWTSPVALGIPANYIDSFLVKVGGTYHNFLKNETTKYIEHATATSLNGPWQFVGTGDWAGWGSGLEGPAVVQLPDGRWRISFDQYGTKRYYYADSSGLNSFGAKVELPGLSGTARPFTVLRENVGDSTAVATGRRSPRSANVTDRYLRHRDNLAYIDPISTATDRADATSTVVAGLANGNCYSFESVNFPGSYPRHNNMRLVLNNNDGSAVFPRRRHVLRPGRARRRRHHVVRVVQLPGSLPAPLQLRAAPGPEELGRGVRGRRVLHRDRATGLTAAAHVAVARSAARRVVRPVRRA